MEKISGIRGEISENGFVARIGLYVMQPYKLVKDHWTGEEIGNVDSVMDGNIEPFINAYLKWLSVGGNTDKRGIIETDRPFENH